MATGIRKAGDFCWINVVTPQIAESMGFFTKVLGWTFADMAPFGHSISAGGKRIGGLYDLSDSGFPPGHPPVIGSVVKVENVDATVEKLKALGGKTEAVHDVGEHGRMASCFDPNGAEFALWEPKIHHGTDADSAVHGSPSWSETLTTDVAKATEFYKSLFGWTSTVNQMPGMEYTIFGNEGENIAGMMHIPHPDIPSHWGTYFTVENVDETANTAAESGATVCIPPADIPGTGRFSGLISPQGVRFSVIQYLPRQAS